MATEYSEIYDVFKNKIEDNHLAMLDQDDQNRELNMWLNQAISTMELENIDINHDLDDRNDAAARFRVELDNKEIEIISMYMVIAWYDQKINALEHTAMYFGSKDEKWTSQKDHLNMMKEAKKMYQKNAKRLCLTYFVKHNSYLEGNS